MSIHEIRVTNTGEDPRAAALSHRLGMMLGVEAGAVVTNTYLVEGLTADEAQVFADQALCDANIQTADLTPRQDWDNPSTVDAAPLPGMMDPDVEFIERAARLLGLPLTEVAKSTEYNLRLADPSRLPEVAGVLVNKHVQHDRRALPETLAVRGDAPPTETIPITWLTDTELAELSRRRSLFLDKDELRNIQEHFGAIGREPTDAELEYLGCAWSEHCCHKTFNAKIFTKEGVEKSPLFRRLREASEPYFGDEVVSAYDDNSGVFMFYDGMCIAMKLETHNSPSALDPYGGSETGSGGVFRDIMGTGKGAKNILSIDIFCFAPTDLPAEQLPAGCLAPAYLLQRCVDGVRDYGNRMGIPTANGSIHYHPDFRAKPTVMVGALGIIPEEYAQKGAAEHGDLVVTIGGRTGLDGVHGATFSSGSMTAETASLHSSAVQIGNAIEEKRMADALLEARDAGLIRAMTDCGAAGFASAVGEMGEDIGVQIDLAKAPLKYEGLAPWQILISESQERMVAAIAPDRFEEFLEICTKHGVEAAALGTFGTDGGPRLDVKHGDEQVVDLDYDFIKRGRTQREMIADWQAPDIAEVEPQAMDWGGALKRLMAHPNIRSNQPVVQQYDHEVQGTSVMKPYAGVHKDAPNNAAVLTPILGKPYGLIEAHGMNPALNNYDPYKGTVWAFAEAMANYVAAGGNPDVAMLSDNFVTATPDAHVMGALDKMVDAYVDCIHAVERPVITGKDSLSSRYKNADDSHIDVPPVITVTVAGKIPDVAKTVSTDIKRFDSRLVLVGKMDYESMGGSAYHDIADGSSAQIPNIDLGQLPKTLRAVHGAIQTDEILACHDVSEGGIAAAVSEMCFGGDCGVDLIAPEGVNDTNFLFNETAGCFVVEVTSEADLGALFGDTPHVIIGATKSEQRVTLVSDDLDREIFSVGTHDLKAAWQRPMQEFFA